MTFKEWAKSTGTSIWTAFIDDWLENVGWTVAGIGIGYLLGKFL